MVISCSFAACEERRRPGGPAFFRFPEDPKLRKKWCDRTGIENFVPSESSRFCSKHFKAEDIFKVSGRKNLKKGAVPTFEGNKGKIKPRRPPSLRNKIKEKRTLAPGGSIFVTLPGTSTRRILVPGEPITFALPRTGLRSAEESVTIALRETSAESCSSSSDVQANDTEVNEDNADPNDSSLSTPVLASGSQSASGSANASTSSSTHTTTPETEIAKESRDDSPKRKKRHYIGGYVLDDMNCSLKARGFFKSATAEDEKNKKKINALRRRNIRLKKKAKHWSSVLKTCQVNGVVRANAIYEVEDLTATWTTEEEEAQKDSDVDIETCDKNIQTDDNDSGRDAIQSDIGGNSSFSETNEQSWDSVQAPSDRSTNEEPSSTDRSYTFIRNLHIYECDRHRNSRNTFEENARDTYLLSSIFSDESTNRNMPRRHPVSNPMNMTNIPFNRTRLNNFIIRMRENLARNGQNVRNEISTGNNFSIPTIIVSESVNVPRNRQNVRSEASSGNNFNIPTNIMTGSIQRTNHQDQRYEPMLLQNVPKRTLNKTSISTNTCNGASVARNFPYGLFSNNCRNNMTRNVPTSNPASTSEPTSTRDHAPTKALIKPNISRKSANGRASINAARNFSYGSFSNNCRNNMTRNVPTSNPASTSEPASTRDHAPTKALIKPNISRKSANGRASINAARNFSYGLFSNNCRNNMTRNVPTSNPASTSEPASTRDHAPTKALIKPNISRKSANGRASINAARNFSYGLFSNNCRNNMAGSVPTSEQEHASTSEYASTIEPALKSELASTRDHASTSDHASTKALNKPNTLTNSANGGASINSARNFPYGLLSNNCRHNMAGNVPTSEQEHASTSEYASTIEPALKSELASPRDHASTSDHASTKALNKPNTLTNSANGGASINSARNFPYGLFSNNCRNNMAGNASTSENVQNLMTGAPNGNNSHTYANDMDRNIPKSGFRKNTTNKSIHRNNSNTFANSMSENASRNGHVCNLTNSTPKGNGSFNFRNVGNGNAPRNVLIQTGMNEFPNENRCNFANTLNDNAPGSGFGDNLSNEVFYDNIRNNFMNERNRNAERKGFEQNPMNTINTILNGGISNNFTSRTNGIIPDRRFHCRRRNRLTIQRPSKRKIKGATLRICTTCGRMFQTQISNRPHFSYMQEHNCSMDRNIQQRTFEQSPTHRILNRNTGTIHQPLPRVNFQEDVVNNDCPEEENLAKRKTSYPPNRNESGIAMEQRTSNSLSERTNEQSVEDESVNMEIEFTGERNVQRNGFEQNSSNKLSENTYNSNTEKQSSQTTAFQRSAVENTLSAEQNLPEITSVSQIINVVPIKQRISNSLSTRTKEQSVEDENVNTEVEFIGEINVQQYASDQNSSNNILSGINSNQKTRKQSPQTTAFHRSIVDNSSSIGQSTLEVISSNNDTINQIINVASIEQKVSNSQTTGQAFEKETPDAEVEIISEKRAQKNVCKRIIPKESTQQNALRHYSAGYINNDLNLTLQRRTDQQNSVNYSLIIPPNLTAKIISYNTNLNRIPTAFNRNVTEYPINYNTSYSTNNNSSSTINTPASTKGDEPVARSLAMQVVSEADEYSTQKKEVMNKFLSSVGVPEEWSMIDVIDLDDEHLDNLPKKVKAVLLLFPKGEQHEEHCQSEQETIENDGQVVSDRVYFIKLESNNSSGTVSMIHAIANADEELGLAEDSPLKEFLDRTKDMSPEERGQELEMTETLCGVHDEVAKEGQTEAPEADDETNLHFITFVAVDEQLYELDAHKNVPINHGSTSMETLLKDAVAACKQFMERDPENVNFSIMALVSGGGEAEADE